MNSSDPPAKRGTKASRQRFKPQLSCTLCRTRKLKCDRNNPCQNCIRRGQVSSCTYVRTPAEAARSTSIQKPTNTPRGNLHSQIAHLEELVVSLMNKLGAPGPTIRPERILHDSKNDHEERATHKTGDAQVTDLTLNPKDDEWTESGEANNATESFGIININDEGSNYVDSSHWTAILEKIAYLKDSLEKTNEEQHEAKIPWKSQGPTILTGLVKQATRIEILIALPSKIIVDHLIEVYCSIADNGAIVLHQPTFKKEYESFWRNPSTAPIAWIGMLFSILFQAVQFHIMASTSFPNFDCSTAIPEPVEMINIFSEKTVQCLILGNYTEPGPYTIETLLFYYIGEHFRSVDTVFGLWMIFAVIVRAGMRLGLHRDPSHSSKISVMRGEMNRRIWSCLVHLDLWSSCQVGLPRMIREEMYDTREPSNLLDEDFDENTMALPAPRINDLTPMAYYNMKHRIVKVFGEIMDQTTLVRTIPYEQVMTLDKSLVDVYQALPELLKVRGVDDLKIGSVDTQIRKFNCLLTFHKSRCFLHRKFFVLSKDTSTYTFPYSMKSCVDAAIEILQAQIYMHAQQKTGMPLYSSRWKSSSLVAHDFLLAATLVCVYIGHCLAIPSLERTNFLLGTSVKASCQDIQLILENSYQIWIEASSTSREASKVARALKEMLKRARAVAAAPLQVSILPNVQPESISGTTPQPYSKPDLHPWMAPEIPEHADLLWGTTPSFDTMNSSGTNPSTNFMGDVLAVDETLFPIDLDWDLWDTEFQVHAGIAHNNLQDMPVQTERSSTNPGSMQWEQQ